MLSCHRRRLPPSPIEHLYHHNEGEGSRHGAITMHGGGRWLRWSSQIRRKSHAASSRGPTPLCPQRVSPSAGGTHRRRRTPAFHAHELHQLEHRSPCVAGAALLV